MPTTKNTMTSGSIGKAITFFAVPLILGNFFQQLYNAADSLIVGNLLGDRALAAVSGTSNLIFLLVGFINGISLGAGVVIAQEFGAARFRDMRHSVHTLVAFGLAAGLLLTVFGVLFTPQILRWMNTPADVFADTAQYLRVYFAGALGLVVYNVLASILQAVGNSRYPLYFLIFSSVVNVVLDIAFISLCHWGVWSAAAATVISQLLSAVLCGVVLCRAGAPCHLSLRSIRFHSHCLRPLAVYGFPSGMQNCVIGLSNVVIQSAINSFGSTVVAGSSASANLEGFVYTAMNAFSQAAVTFTSQNMGARKYQNLNRVVLNCLLCAIVTGVVLGGGAVLAGTQLLHFYSSDAAVIAAGYERLRVICGTYLLCGIMDTLASSLRGLGYSVLPMVVSLVGSCLLRLVWIATIFQLNRTPFMLYISYPISWVLTASVHLICLLVVRRKLQKKGQNLQAA